MEKCGRQKVLTKFFLSSETQIENSDRQFFFRESERRERVWGHNGDFFCKRTRLNTNMLIIHQPLKNHIKQIEHRPYTQFHATAKCFKSTLYLLLWLTEKLLFGSLFKIIHVIRRKSVLYLKSSEKVKSN